MESKELLRRVHELEMEIQKLKEVMSATRQRPVKVVVKKSVGFVLTYWTLLSFIVALGGAFYIKYAFNVDYFENYRSMDASRRLSGFHTKLGNALIGRQQWAAAEEAFTRALAANANNTEASYGLVKSRVFKAPAGEKEPTPEMQITMIRFLRNERPQDQDLDLMEALIRWATGQHDAAQKLVDAAIAKAPGFSIALQFRSYMAMTAGNISEAIDWSRKAIAADEENAMALSNFGFLMLLTGDAAGAIDRLERAYDLGPNLLTALVLSDAYRLSGRFEEAVNWSGQAARLASDEALRDSPFSDGEWVYSFLPLSRDDRSTWKNHVFASRIDRKEAFCHFAHALDLALTGDIAAADQAWLRATKLAPEPECMAYYQNKIEATLAGGDPKIPDSASLWLKARLQEIAGGGNGSDQ